METKGQYTKKICISLWGDKINPDQLIVGNELDIDFDIESREYTGKWYTEVKAWKIAVASLSALTSTFKEVLPIGDEDALPF